MLLFSDDVKNAHSIFISLRIKTALVPFFFCSVRIATYIDAENVTVFYRSLQFITLWEKEKDYFSYPHVLFFYRCHSDFQSAFVCVYFQDNIIAHN